MEVQPRAGMLVEPTDTEHGGHIRLIRALILAETHVAVDAIDRLVGRGYEIASEALQLFPKRQHQFDHLGLDLLVVKRLVRLEPIAVIASFEVAKKLQRFRREAGEAGRHGISWFGGSRISL